MLHRNGRRSPWGGFGSQEHMLTGCLGRGKCLYNLTESLPRAAPPGHGTDHQPGRRHLSCQRGGPLPGAHLSLPRVPPARCLPSAQLRPAAASERRSPGRDPELSDHRRSAHRPVATHRRTLCRASGHAGASGREAGRRIAQDLRPSVRASASRDGSPRAAQVRQRSGAILTRYALAELYRS